MIGADQEGLQRGSEEFEDAVLLEFSDLEHDLFGLVRLARGSEGSSVFGLLFADGALVSKQADLLPETAIAGWDRAVAGGARLEIEEPLRRWNGSFAAGDASFEVEAVAIAEPIEVPDPAAEGITDEVAATRYEHVCEVRGEASVGGQRREVAGVGRRVHGWGSPRRPDRGVLRSLYAASPDEALTLTAVRPTTGDGHGGERIQAWSAKGDAAPAAFEDARVSTIYDRGGEIRKAGLELYMAGEEFPRRASGEARAAAVLEAGACKLSISFLRWSIQGSPAQGSYAVVSPA